jgi:methylated-DNA-protein-cysteine methyltransferase-like protein
MKFEDASAGPLCKGMNESFREAVYAIVAQIPFGRVMTYGDIAVHVGRPYAARQVGGIAHFGPSELPWHRVVNRFGDCASGYYGGKAGHQAALESEGIWVEKYRITEFEKVRWRP